MLKINCQSLFTAEQVENTKDFRLNCQLTEFKTEKKNMYSAPWVITHLEREKSFLNLEMQMSLFWGNMTCILRGLWLCLFS